jgi:hypothetical protein
MGGRMKLDDAESSLEDGLVSSGLVVLCESARVEAGRGGITGFVSVGRGVKLCRGLFTLLVAEILAKRHRYKDRSQTIYPSRLEGNMYPSRRQAGVELVAAKAKTLVRALGMQPKVWSREAVVVAEVLVLWEHSDRTTKKTP